MKKANIFQRLLCMMLVLVMVLGNALPGHAATTHDHNGNNVSFHRVDNSEVSAGLTPGGKTNLKDEVPYADTDIVRVSIILNKRSTIEAGFSAMDIANDKAAITYRAGLKKEQATLVQKIEATIQGKLDVVWNLTLAANVISANVQYGQIKAIEKLAGVKSVVIENRYVAEKTQSGNTTNMATSGAQIGSGLVWDAGYTGAGTRIAVIDTGTDTDHQSLNGGAFEHALRQLAAKANMTYEDYIKTLDLLDAEEIARVAGDLNVVIDPNKAYFNTKLPFGFNYKDGDYDITHDNDEEGEHGSHVAGIATANSYIIGRDGQYYKALDTVMMQGVAPEAQLLTMKVFGKGGSPYDSDYMAAIEDAIVLGADVVNLSLGSVAPGRSAHANPVFEQIMEDLSKSGVVVAVSAGNAGAWAENAENGGYLYNTDVSMDTIGQPGSFTNSMAVASVENDGMVGYYVSVKDQMIVYNENLFNSQRPFTSIAGEYEYIFLDGVGKAEDWAAVADVLPGKIALCSRGETNFVEKATLAVNAGAVAVLIYNNTDGMINLDLTEYVFTNPVASLTQKQGAAIRAASEAVTDAEGRTLYLTGKMTVSASLGMGYFDSKYYTLSSFSSWGVPGSLELKPEITAPGGNIFSLNGLEPSGGGYEIMSGTSMASPQVAGMAALLMQYVRANGLAQKTGLSERHLVQSLLMSTAKPLLAQEDVYYSILQQGAGLANIYSAISADSYITMAAGSSAGAADGKIKVELYDDPQRTGAYSATFTVHNLKDVEKVLDLNADFFVQNLLDDGTFLYMDTTTALISTDVVWSIGGKAITPVGLEGMDFNGDGKISAGDGQLLLDHATGAKVTLHNKHKADVDGDGDIDSHDAYAFLKALSSISTVLPAGGSVEITVDFSLTAEIKEELDKSYPNGTYIQGFLYAETEQTSHSIPVLGFYGNWSDPSMFDVGTWPEYATGEETRIPYIGRTRGNEFKVEYANDPGYLYSFGGNPLIPDSVYMPERNAMNSADALGGVSFIAIRHADQSRVVVVNETTGEVMVDVLTGPVDMAYFYGVLGWQNTGATLQTNFSLADTNEGDVISMDFSLVPEYYVDAEGNVDWDALGKGTSLGTSFVIDNTAPELLDISMSIIDNTMTITASDNEYIAAVGIYNKTGTRCLASTGAKQDIEKGEVAEYTFSLDKVNGKKFLVQVFDYAMNVTTYLVEMQIGEEAELPEMMAFDLVSYHWAGFTKDFEYDYKVGTDRVAFSDHTFYAATIAEHYVFASTSKGELYVMPEDDLTDTTYITDLEMVLYDMAYNPADGEIYAVDESGTMVKFHKLTGEVSYVGKIGLKTNTLACSPEGVFYCNELGTGRVYSFTLDTMNAPKLLMEDPYLTSTDPITGAHMGGTTGNMGMEYNPNTGMICWNSHCEMLIGSYITFAHYYEIDPNTGKYTRYADFWHEMSGLIIPERSGSDRNWADPTDQILAVKLNKDQVDVIRGTSTKLIANVQPWTAINRNVIWSSANESVATVDQDGVVTGHRAGKTTIRATSQLDPTFYAECTVNVEILDVTLHGTLTDEVGNSMFYSWDMSTDDGWIAGKALEHTMTSATWSTLEKVWYMMDANSNSWKMHKIGADGNLIESAVNTNGIPLWDMAYSEYFSRQHGREEVSSVYYTYLLSPKDPMDMDAVGFNLGDLADYLVAITSLGYERVADENGTLYDTEHLILLDNDCYIWDFWIYDLPDGGMNALFNISKSDLKLSFPGDSNMENMFTSLVAGDDGNLYLSSFTGETNEIYHLSYDPDTEQYVSAKLGDVGEAVWPATITSVSVNGSRSNAVHPRPTGTMSASRITEEELEAAAVAMEGLSVRFQETYDERAHKLGWTNGSDLVVNSGDGTKDSPKEFVEGPNTGVAPSSGSDKYYYFTYTAATEGTATMTSEGTAWRAAVYIYDANGNTLENGSQMHNPTYDGSTITRELSAGDKMVLKISPYVAYKYGGEITVDFHFASAGGSAPVPTEPTVPPTEPSIPTEPTVPPTTPPTEPPTEPAPTDSLVIGNNALTSGTVYTYTATGNGRLEFDFTSIKDSEGVSVYQYAYGKGTRVDILINGVRAANLLNTKITVSKGQTITVELFSRDGDTYTADMTMSTLAAAQSLKLGENAISKNVDYSFIATKDGTLYTSIMELWCDGTYCSAASLSSSVVFRINGATIYDFNNSFEVKAGDEITVLLGTQFEMTASAKFYLSYEGFYVHEKGSRGNPYTLLFSECPTNSAVIPGNTAVWYQLSGFGSDAYLTVTGANAYVIVGGVRRDAVNGSVTVPAYSSLQIGNAGSTAVSFRLSAHITEGTSGNPKDLVEGNNTVKLGERENFYYDFLAPSAGTVTFTVSGNNWGYQYIHLAADGVQISASDMLYQYKGNSATVTMPLSAGQAIVIKLGTMNSSWTQPGGELTVNFKFTPAGGTDPEPGCTHSNTRVVNQKDATCTEDGYTGDTVCAYCGELLTAGQVIPATGHSYYNGFCDYCGEADPNVPTEPTVPPTEPSVPTDPTKPTEPAPMGSLVIGNNALTSGTVYTYTATGNGRLEFDFTSIKDSEGVSVYQYAYGKGTRVDILINGVRAANLLNTKITVSKGQTITVELFSRDGDTYTADMTMSTLAAAQSLKLGENAISKNVDYSFIATKDGTLYTSIMELWCDGTYCSAASLSSSVVFRINGATIYDFNNSFEVKAGDEITVLLGTQFEMTASAKFYLSYEGFYVHEKGSRGNPYTLLFSECPTNSAVIPGNTAVWYQLSGFGSDAYLTVTGANAYVIVGGVRRDAVNGSVTVPAYSSLQIGNAGSTAVSFRLSAHITEGTSGNPKDLVEGNNTVKLGERENFYYDFLAPSAGTVTFTVSGNNWGYQYIHLAADGVQISASDMLYQYKGNSATVTMPLSAGQAIVIKLGTMNSSWTQPGGELTVNFKFTPAGGTDPEPGCTHSNTRVVNQKDATCTEDGYTGDTVCAYCGELLTAGQVIPATGHSYYNGFCDYCGEADPNVPTEPVCGHNNTRTENQKDATCTEDGYTGDIYCNDCGELLTAGQVIPATGHNYVDGICDACGAIDPDYRPTYVVDVTLDQDVTNGVFTVTWDPAKLTLLDVLVNADYHSIQMGEGFITIGYVSLDGIAAGQPIALLLFEAAGFVEVELDIQHQQINNDLPAPDAPTTWGDVNGDGAVDYMDAYLIMRYAVGMIDPEDLDLSVADVNGDGAVDYMDAYMIMRFAVGMIEGFPVE